MAISSVITLISKSYAVDDIGQRVPSEHYKDIFADIKSVSQTEWYNAGRNGLQPSFVAITPAVNYHGQKEIVYCCKRYSVYRTFVRADDEMIELYLEEKAGS